MLRREPLSRSPLPLVVDDRLEVARAYAPYVYHEVHEERGRQDIPTRVDFDGNLRGDDNWDHLPDYELPPALYYAVLETETHWFIAYHIFHPRDYSCVTLGVHESHENDGENLQVVVRKATGRVELLFTQAHYCGGVYAAPGSGYADGTEGIRGPLLLVDEAGRPAADGRHAAVFVQAYGHGIYGALDGGASKVRVEPDGRAVFERAGLVFRPARPGEGVREPALDAREPVPYALESTAAKLWPGLRDGDRAVLGEDGLVDGTLAYEDERVRIGVPRYYEADRFSGPFGPDRGISPFAVDFGFSEGTLGALFFDPARRYAECLKVPGPWSRAYIRYPFRNKPSPDS